MILTWLVFTSLQIFSGGVALLIIRATGHHAKLEIRSQILLVVHLATNFPEFLFSSHLSIYQQYRNQSADQFGSNYHDHFDLSFIQTQTSWLRYHRHAGYPHRNRSFSPVSSRSHSRKNSNTCCFGSFCQLYPGCYRRKDDHHESQHDHTSKMRYTGYTMFWGGFSGYLHIKRNRFIRAFLRERFNRPPLIYSLPAQNKRISLIRQAS